jgi:tetratricopeptide (TPR) repeat protein
MGYGNKVFSFYEPRAILGLVLLLTLLGYAFIRKYRHGLLSFSICWFFVTLLPQSNLYPINAFMAEHWLYLPSLGFFLILAGSLISLYNKSKYLGLILIMGMLFLYSYFTIRQNNYWREPIPFYKRYLRYDSNNGRIYYNLGINLERAGDFKEAISVYRRALEINPKDINACYHLSNIYYKIKNTEEAIIFLKRAIEAAPGNALVYYWLGNLYNNVYKTNEAVEAYNKTIQIDQNFALAYISLGKILVNSNDKEKAVKMFNKAITLFKKVIEIEPDFALGHANLAVAYYYTGQYDLAIKHCDKAIQFGYEVKARFLEDLKPHRKNVMIHISQGVFK